jgi:hypothetical protein
MPSPLAPSAKKSIKLEWNPIILLQSFFQPQMTCKKVKPKSFLFSWEVRSGKMFIKNWRKNWLNPEIAQ